jgi:hypothetical protein
VSIALATITDLAVNTIRVSASWWPWAVWSASCLLVAVTIFADVRRKRPGGQASAATDPAELDEAASQLAQSVGSQWRGELERQRLHDPGPIPVRWHPVHELMDHLDNICRDSPRTKPHPLALGGSLERIVDVYLDIPSGRLVVVGRPGAGKTILALRFLVDLIDIRASNQPVPVLFSLGLWNPRTTPLPDWLISELIREHPALGTIGRGGSSLAAALIAAGRILPVLDGFDEIAGGLHGAALGRINATALPLLLTSRYDDYAAVVRANRILGASAVIQLDDLTPADLGRYLPLTTTRIAAATQFPGGSSPTVWDPVLACLEEQSASPAQRLRRVLSTPLMVALARAIYSDTAARDPAELLDPRLFATIDGLEDHLLGAFIPAVHGSPPCDQWPGRRQRWDAARAQRWLGYLAWHLDRLGTRNLALWQLGEVGSRLPAALLASSAEFVLFWLAGIPNAGIGCGAIFALVLALAGGLSFGLGERRKPSRAEVRFRGTAAPFVRRFLAGAAVGLLYGLACGLKLDSALIGGVVAGLAFGSYGWLHVPATISVVPTPLTVLRQDRVATLTFGLGAGLAVGTCMALIAWRSGPPAPEAPAGLAGIIVSTLMGLAAGSVIGGLAYRRAGALIFGPAMGALTLGAHWAPGGIAGLAMSPPVTALFGASYGLAIAVIIVAPRAWGTYTVTRVWLALRGDVPWRLMAFLEHAHDRGILRQSGGVYQFRHAQLQDHLARDYQARWLSTAARPSISTDDPERRDGTRRGTAPSSEAAGAGVPFHRAAETGIGDRGPEHRGHVATGNR